MAKRIKSKKIKMDFQYGFESIILIILFGVITFLTGKYFGKKENYRPQNIFDDNFEKQIKQRLANLNKI